jgi:hypothetical protein
MKGRLNLFQASMLRWRAFYPYNAVHVLRIAGALDAQRLARAVGDVLRGAGLTRLELDPARRRYQYAPADGPVAVAVIPHGADADAAVDEEIERQLNTPFPAAGPLEPFRFFAVERAGAFDLGLAYDHFIAAGDSIVLLMKAIGERYGGAAPQPAYTPELYPPAYRRLFLRQLGPLLLGLRRLPALVAAFRHAYRPRYPHGRAPDMGFARVRVDAEGVAAIRRRAKDWAVTFNDIVLALLLLALSPLTEARRSERRRNRLAVASIVNIRADCGVAAREAFGQFLSSFLVAHPVPAGITLERLAREVAADSGRLKREKLYLQTLLAIGAVGLAWPAMPQERRARFHSKAYPVWAGTTSVNVDPLWERAPGAAPVLAYLRAVPTGPLAPLVVAVTTAGGGVELGLSFRTAAFTREDVAKISASVLRHIDILR